MNSTQQLMSRPFDRRIIALVTTALLTLILAFLVHRLLEGGGYFKTEIMTVEDQNVWLEEVLDVKALDWVKGVCWSGS
jgi:hypothetical protein